MVTQASVWATRRGSGRGEFGVGRGRRRTGRPTRTAACDPRCVDGARPSRVRRCARRPARRDPSGRRRGRDRVAHAPRPRGASTARRASPRDVGADRGVGCAGASASSDAPHPADVASTGARPPRRSGRAPERRLAGARRAPRAVERGPSRLGLAAEQPSASPRAAQAGSAVVRPTASAGLGEPGPERGPRRPGAPRPRRRVARARAPAPSAAGIGVAPGAGGGGRRRR